MTRTSGRHRMLRVCTCGRGETHGLSTRGERTSHHRCCCVGVTVGVRGDSLWVDTSHSFRTTPACSAPDRCSFSRSRQSCTPSLYLMNQSKNFTRCQRAHRLLALTLPNDWLSRFLPVTTQTNHQGAARLIYLMGLYRCVYITP